MMTTEQIAKRLVELCRAGDFSTCHAELYSTEAESCEPEGWGPVSTKGIEAIREKGRKWQESVEEVHHSEISDPIVANQSFACTMHMDVTMKGEGRMDMKELCVYQIKDGKIIKEEFFA